MTESNDARLRGGVYKTEIQCVECLTKISVRFNDPSEAFAVTCPECGTHYPELYV